LLIYWNNEDETDDVDRRHIPLISAKFVTQHQIMKSAKSANPEIIEK